MDIIEAEPKHLARIAELKQAMFEEIGKGHRLAPDFKELVLADYRLLYQRAEARHVLAVDESGIQGMAGGFLKADIPYRYFKTPHYGFVGDVYILPSARQRGLAAELSGRVLAWLKSRGVDSVRLLASEAARPIYERLGFRATNEMALDC